MTGKIKQLKEAIRHPYAWPGGYEISAVMNDGASLCMACCRDNFRNIVDSTNKQIRDGWQLEAVDVIWEGDCRCEQCGKNLAVYEDDEDEQA
jgi:hypothetical protein